jgi:hypothetical protein
MLVASGRRCCRRSILRGLAGAAVLTIARSGSGGVAAHSADSGVALGVFAPGAPGNPSRLDDLAGRIGRMPAVVMWYQAWGSEYSAFDPGLLAAVAERGGTPMISWEPWDPAAGSSEQPDYALARIAAGDCDEYIDAWARGFAAYGKPVLLRFAHEMNGDWYPWSATVNGNTPADYVAAWRHLRRRFAAAGAANVRWVWSPNVEYEGSTPLNEVYPGDDHVDWVGIDGYNWGTTQTWSSWQSLADVFGPTYDAVRQLTERPVMIAETASGEQGGDKATWIEDAFLHALPARFPAVRAVVWFNQNKETDWRFESSDTAAAAFRRIATDPTLQAPLA